jgi:hypothetical protein
MAQVYAAALLIRFSSSLHKKQMNLSGLSGIMDKRHRRTLPPALGKGGAHEAAE